LRHRSAPSRFQVGQWCEPPTFFPIINEKPISPPARLPAPVKSPSLGGISFNESNTEARNRCRFPLGGYPPLGYGLPSKELHPSSGQFFVVIITRRRLTMPSSLRKAVGSREKPARLLPRTPNSTMRIRKRWGTTPISIRRKLRKTVCLPQAEQ